MTDVSVSECVSMVHPISSDGSRPTENHAGPADHLGGVVVPPTTPAATNNKVESSSTISKPSRQQKPVSHGGPVRETQPGSTRPVIHRYSPLGVPKPHQTARVVRMVERAQREFEKAEQQSPYHSKHGRPAIPTPEAYQSLQMGHQNMEYMGGNGVSEAPPDQLPGQPKRQPQMVGNPSQRPSYPSDHPSVRRVSRGGGPPPPVIPQRGAYQSRVKTSHDRLIDAEFNRDVSQCLVVHGGRALGLERERCETSGLKALVEKNIASFETQSDAIKLGCLLIAKKLNQLTERWVGSE